MGDDSLVQNRFVAALIVTAFIMVILGVMFAVFRNRDRIQLLLQRQIAAQAFKYVVGGAAVLVLLSSLFPQENPEAGILLYFILWPLLGLQLVLALLPWQRFAQKRPVMTSVAAGMAIAYAVPVDILMLTLAGYIGT
jgi:hypothetical protein